VSRAAVFLDRDGTPVEEVRYLTEPPQRASYLGRYHTQEHRRLIDSCRHCASPTWTRDEKRPEEGAGGARTILGRLRPLQGRPRGSWKGIVREASG
jgi:hypothetical protein